MTDGTSKTIILAESKEQLFSSWYDGTTSFVTAIPLNNSALNGAGTMATNSPPQPVKTDVTGANTGITVKMWGFVGAGGTPVSALNYGPKLDAAKVYKLSNAGTAGITAVEWGPSSDHTGGVVLHAWADSHISSINEDIDPTVYLQLSTRAGREAASDPTN